jgi:elongation factor Ts
MAITTEQIKALRDRTGISIMQCKKALEEAGGDMEKALIILRRKGADIAAKKGDRTLGAGAVASYIHNNGSVGALVELFCETDFVSNNDEFKVLARDIAMQVAATKPEFLKREDISEAAKAAALEVLSKEVEGKPEDMKAKILEGKLGAYFEDKVLMEQSFIKNDELTIEQLISNAVQKFGEKIEIGRFVRFSVGEK